jgi:inositol oxygenase
MEFAISSSERRTGFTEREVCRMEPSQTKRRRCEGYSPVPTQPWLQALSNRESCFAKTLHLVDLFPSSDQQEKDNHSVRQSSGFTLRLEHRQGGAVARHPGEERILLFRSDRPGAIAKVIYSLEEQKMQQEHDEQAKIYVLDVKAPYRGYDFGGLLFREALASLRHRYQTQAKQRLQAFGNTPRSSCNNGVPSSLQCVLDAEEDVERHDKLVNFYKRMGCAVKPDAKIQYLHNNDGTTYRKITMLRTILFEEATARRDTSKYKKTDTESLVGRNGGFLPVILLQAPGKRAGCATEQLYHIAQRVEQHWLLVEDGFGQVELWTTCGRCLFVTEEGRCKTDGGSSATHEACKFRLLRFSDATQTLNDDENDSDEHIPEARLKELWMLQSSRGLFLCLDAKSSVMSCSRTPAFWQASRDNFSLTCTTDTPPRRQHYRQQWKAQTVDYVYAMRDRYLKFNHGSLTIRQALDAVQALPEYPFDISGRSVSLRTRCFRTAEIARHAGHPDWVQLLALMYCLGSVAHVLETYKGNQNEYNWTISSRGWIVGCAPPLTTVFSEFRSLNQDTSDSRYSSLYGMYHQHVGLSNVLLTWTGPEYLYHVLQHNDVSLPEEGLTMLRLASIFDWHSNNQYLHLCNDDDQEVRALCADFDTVMRDTSSQCNGATEWTDAECESLWVNHYGDIAAKYDVDGVLEW